MIFNDTDSVYSIKNLQTLPLYSKSFHIKNINLSTWQTHSICRQWVSLLFVYSKGSRLFLLFFSSNEVLNKYATLRQKPAQNRNYLIHLSPATLQVVLSSLYSDFECTSIYTALLLTSQAVERKERTRTRMPFFLDTVLLISQLHCLGRLFCLLCWSLKGACWYQES